MDKEKLKRTKQKYTIKGEYTLQRSLCHAKIIKDILQEFKGTGQPVAILMGGGSASGKTWLRGLIHQEQKDLDNHFLIIDSDEIKKELPEYKDLFESNPKKMASLLHDESSDISFNLLIRCITEKINFIYDGTMKNLEKYNKIITALEENGYQIRAAIADVELDEAIRRNEERFERTKRRVPVNELINSHVGVSETFMQLKDRLTEFALYDTTDGYDIFAKKTLDEGEQIINDQRMQAFVKKAGIQIPVAGVNGKKKSS
jgi:Zeta toxin.